MNNEHPTVKRTLRLMLLVLSVCGAWPVSFASAQVPRLLRYQGQAVDSNKVPLEGPYQLTFRLYEAATGGSPVWTEVQTSVAIQEGQFSVLLGQVSSMNAIEWAAPGWLSVQVNDEAELTPRQQITSVPLAIRSEVAERLTTPVTTSTISDDASRLVPSGAVILWTSTACPTGYTRLSTLDGKFLVSGSAFSAAAGGSNSHTHSAGSFSAASHSHSGTTSSPVSGAFSDGGSGDRSYSSGSHTHNLTTSASGALPVSGTSAAADSRPEFATVILCQKD